MTDRAPLHPLPQPERVECLAAMGLGPDLIPLNATEAERTAAMPIDPATGAPIVSPTGAPVIAGTGWVLKAAAVLVAIAGVMLVNDFFPATHLDETIAGAVVSLGTVLGIASPGLRK